MIRKGVLFLIVLSLLGLACGQSGVPREEMSRGERLFRANCRSCHILPKADKFTDQEWLEFIPGHVGAEDLSEEKQRLITEHLRQAN